MMHQPVDGDPQHPAHNLDRCAPALHRVALDCNVDLGSLWLNTHTGLANRNAVSVIYRWSCAHHTQVTTAHLPGCHQN